MDLHLSGKKRNGLGSSRDDWYKTINLSSALTLDLHKFVLFKCTTSYKK